MSLKKCQTQNIWNSRNGKIVVTETRSVIASMEKGDWRHRGHKAIFCEEMGMLFVCVCVCGAHMYGYNQKDRWVGEGAKKLLPSCIAGGNVKWWSCFGKQFGSCSKVDSMTCHFCKRENSKVVGCGIIWNTWPYFCLKLGIVPLVVGS